jgi:hypothetical protein
MPVGRSGNYYGLRAKRLCLKCHEVTDQTAISCRYSAPEVPDVPSVLVKRLEWICDRCDNYEEEVKEVLLPTDKTKIIKTATHHLRRLRCARLYPKLGI